MKPLTIVVYFDIGEQVVPGSIPGWVASLVHEFGFDRAEAAFHRGIVPTICLAAHELDHSGCIEDLVVTGGGILAAAVAVVNQAWRRLLALDGHGQGRDRQFRPHVVTQLLLDTGEKRAWSRHYRARHAPTVIIGCSDNPLSAVRFGLT
jgi:hypothetical protein